MRYKAPTARTGLLIAGILAGAVALAGLAGRFMPLSATLWFTPPHQLPAKLHGIIFLGDSITEQGRWRECLQHPDAINRGVGNDTSADVLARLDAIYRLQPRQIFLMIGINDLHRRSLGELQADYRAILDGLEQHLPRSRVMVQSLLPANDRWRHPLDRRDIVRMNRFLEEEAQRRGLTYIDLYTAFSDSRGKLRQELSNDGLHLLGAGYALWCQRIGPLLQR